jgi:predicted metal-dependent hydrolase
MRLRPAILGPAYRLCSDAMNAGFEEALRAGIDLFNRQEFYEAHEAWEAGWKDEISDDRLLLQGLIQVAAGFYKLQVGTPTGTVKLLEAGLTKLRPFLEDSHGVDLVTLIPQVEAWLETARGLVLSGRAEYDPKRLPRLGYAPLLH